MKRIEVIISQSISEDFIFLCENKGITLHYTKIPNVIGKGFSDPKLGDAVWPQLNDYYVIFAKDETAQVVYECINALRESYKNEGIYCFETEGIEK